MSEADEIWGYTKTGRMNHKQILIDYLKSKVELADWHAVSDAANDLRVMESVPAAKYSCVNCGLDFEYESKSGCYPACDTCYSNAKEFSDKLREKNGK